MKKRRPDIGVTGPDRGGESAWLFTWFAIWLQGGRAVRITPSKSDSISELSLDGLVLGGGADINPKRYGAELLESGTSQKPKPSGLRQWLYLLLSYLVLPALFLFRTVFSVRRSRSMEDAGDRDTLEFALLQYALDKGIPVLGICRGAQLINVQLGGSLYQDIGSFYTEVPKVHTVWPEKKVEIKPGSRLGEIINSSFVWVNALHNQAVNKLGNSLVAAATEENGIIQAIESPDHPFLIGVQWHPEYMPQIPFQRNIFRELVAKAKEGRAVKRQNSSEQIPDNIQVQNSGS